MKKNELMRTIPSIEQLATQTVERTEYECLSHGVLVEILRHATQVVRTKIMAELSDTETMDPDKILEQILTQAIKERDRLLQPQLRSVINATGIILHTNLGRAPLSERAKQHVNRVLEGYCTLEYDLETGKRGDRYKNVSQRIAEASGAEAALIVNNNAAAVMLVLTAFARGKEIIVSRGELVEIGGSFRVPDVMRQSGAILIEAGATNKTHIDDYAGALTVNTAAILKVHTSNYRIIGFASTPEPAEICELAHRHGIIAINDLGSGSLKPISYNGYSEPTVEECIKAGFDLVTFSGDKLLGAGQAGIIAGKRQYIEQLRKEPLLRALRIDKLSLAALEGTLIDYAAGLSEKTIPTWTMLTLSQEELKKKAEKLLAELAKIMEEDWQLRVVPTQSLAGGGSLPAVEMPGFGVEIIPSGISAARLEEKLRKGTIPIIGLVRGAAVIFDTRCLLNDDDQKLCQGLAVILKEIKK